ncbi:MAG: biopolymer transporter ExbD [Pirellulales bacterium]
MRLPTRKRTSGASFNMTPMIDVVFLLIIFFLVSSHLAKQEVQLDLDLPAAASGADQEEENRPRVTINVLPRGEILLAGAPVAPSELQRRLQHEAARVERDLEVRIRSDRTVPYQYVEPILLACARAGVWNVTFAVVEQAR